MAGDGTPQVKRIIGVALGLSLVIMMSDVCRISDAQLSCSRAVADP